MWFLFSVRFPKNIRQFIIQDNDNDTAVLQLKDHPDLQFYSSEWGSNVWIFSTYYSENEIREP